MLFNYVLGPVLSFIAAIFSVLPTANTSFLGNAAQLANSFVPFLGEAGIVLPMQLLDVLVQAVVLVLIPAVFVYEVAQWTYREVPMIFGFGS